MEYLYHYTSLDTLALILHNRTICFNNLLYVDDSEEAETDDMGKFGRFVYVSCWTDDHEESIPLWNMYTPNMHGVRIRMPKFPFRKFKYRKGELFLSEDIETRIDMKKLYDENKISIASTEPHFVKIEYTEEYDKLYPKIRTESCLGALKVILGECTLDDIGVDNAEVNYDFKHLGIYKRTNWSFQKEYRYIITSMPIGMQELGCLSFEKKQELYKRIEDRDLEPPYKRLFLELSDEAFLGMEVVFGPRMSDAEKIMAKSLLNQYCPHADYRESSLRIK
ncbi:MAG: DUF2971 domain-containing protein [Lachnospiraceae bacterium]|jgi:hypothetical protein|nr:DUF2971 domain-containing protein [Lachnospiraceae bacterium]